MISLRHRVWFVLAIAGSLARCGGESPVTSNPPPATSEPPPGTSAPPPNRPPVAVRSVPPVTVTVGESLTFGVGDVFSDPDGDPLNYSASSSSTGVASVSVSGSQVTVTGAGPGQAGLSVTASDPGGASATTQVSVTVESANQAPSLNSGHADGHVVADTIQVGVSEDWTLFADVFSDPDGDPLTYAASSTDTALVTVSLRTRETQWAGDPQYRLGAVAPGNARVSVTATDPGGLSATLHSDVTVRQRNRAPERTADSIPSVAIGLGQTVTMTADIQAFFHDPDGDALDYEILHDERVVEAALSGSTLTVRGVALGSDHVLVSVTDPGGYGVSLGFRVVVAPDTHSCGRGQETPVPWWSPPVAGVLTVGDEDCFTVQVPDDVQSGRVTVWTTEDHWVRRALSVDTRGTLSTDSYRQIEENNDASPGTAHFKVVARDAGPGQVFHVSVRAHGEALASGHYRITVDDHGNSIHTATEEWESRGSYLAVQGHIQATTSDADLFAFTVPRAGTVSVGTVGQTHTYGTLLDASGDVIQSQVHSGGEGGNFLLLRHLDPGRYHIVVYGGEAGPYELRLELP